MTIDEIKEKYQNDYEPSFMKVKAPKIKSTNKTSPTVALSELKNVRTAFIKSLDGLIRGVELGIKDADVALKYATRITNLGKMLDTIPKPKE